MSNEQRAHDLALLYAELMYKKANTQNFDIYIEYRNMYDRLLNSVNRDFPQN